MNTGLLLILAVAAIASVVILIIILKSKSSDSSSPPAPLATGITTVDTPLPTPAPTTPSFTWPRWATILLLTILVIGGVWFFWGKIKSPFKPDSAGKEPTTIILMPNASKAGEVILQPGESIFVWLSNRSSHTRVTGGCVEMKSEFFLGTDCPGVATSNWGSVTPNNYRITNWGIASVSYKWWSD